MTRQRLAVIAMTVSMACSSHQSSAEFIGLTWTGMQTTLSDGSPIWVVRIYANFDSADNRIDGVHCASADSSLPFYQNAFGSWTEPNPVLIPVFPDVKYDTFLTVGLLTQQPGVSGTMITPGSQFGADALLAGWSASADGEFTHGPSVLIGQFSFQNPPTGPIDQELSTGIEWVDAWGQTHLSCDSLRFGKLTPLACYFPDRADFNHDCTVNGIDLGMLLSAWGSPCPGVPFAACVGELSCDGIVNGMDLAMLLGEWGPVPGCPWQR